MQQPQNSYTLVRPGKCYLDESTFTFVCARYFNFPNVIQLALNIFASDSSYTTLTH